MKLDYKKLLILFCLILSSVKVVYSQACTHYISGGVGPTITAGQVYCQTDTTSGSIVVQTGGILYVSENHGGAVNVQPGGVMKVCANPASFYGSITIGDGAQVVLTGGSKMDMWGGTITASGTKGAGGNQPFAYDGDPTCDAQIDVRATTHLGAPNANPSMGSTNGATAFLTNSSNLHFTGLAWTHSNSSIGSGSTAAPTLCGTVQNCVCAAIDPGAIGSNQTICYNTVPAGLTSTTAASGGDGATYDYQWVSSTDNITWTAIGGATSATYSPGAITTSTYYKRVVSSGVCGDDTTAKVLVTVRDEFAAGSVAAAQTICYNTVPAGLTSGGLPTGGAGGYTYQWQSSTTSAVAGFGNIGGASATTYSPGALTETTWFRRGDIDGSCGTLYTTAIEVTVHADLVAGAIAAAQTIPYNSTPSAFTSTTPASGGGGFTYLWQSSTDGTTFANIAGATAATYTPPAAITQATWYRRSATSSAAEACGTVYTAAVKVTIEANVCNGGTPPNLDEDTGPTGGTGSYDYQWQSSTDGVSFSDIAGATLATYTPTAIAADTWYRREVTSGGCTAYTDAVKAAMTSDPGGISSGLVVWLKADAGTGSIGTQWDDQSGNGYHYTSVGTPSVTAGDSLSNYNSYIELTNAQGFNAHASATLSDEHTIFIVARKTSTDNDGRILDGQIGSNYAWGHHSTYGKSLINNTNPSVGTGAPATTASAEVKMLQTFKRETSGSYTHRVDGDVAATYGSSDDPTNELIDINAGASGLTSSCRVFEFIVYNDALSDSDIEIIESYLMTKYGLGTNDNAYKTSSGGTTYDVTSYNNDIVGIGKECYLNQKQSGAEDDSLRIWVSDGAWAATNAAHTGSIANDVSYVMIGHDNGKLAATAGANAEKPGAITNRWEREFKITNTNFDDDFTLELEWDSAGVFNLADVRLLVDDDGDFSNATIYASGDNGMTFSLGSIKFNNIPVAVIPKGATKFITVGAVGATTLPVELLSFNAAKMDDAVKLTWVTAAEINNDHFDIEKSMDGKNWEVIGTLSGAGNSSQKIEYEFIDYQNCGSSCYYRLKQVDFDESYTYSDVKLVERSAENSTELKVYPVPVAETATVNFTTSETGMYNITINSISGERIFESKVVCAKGSNSFDINTNNFSKGIYYILMSNSTGKILNRIVFTK